MPTRRCEMPSPCLVNSKCVAGDTKYGETYAQALDATDYAYQTLSDAKTLAGKFEITRRRVSLPWSFHAEVQGLEAEAKATAYAKNCGS